MESSDLTQLSEELIQRLGSGGDLGMIDYVPISFCWRKRSGCGCRNVGMKIAKLLLLLSHPFQREWWPMNCSNRVICIWAIKMTAIPMLARTMRLSCIWTSGSHWERYSKCFAWGCRIMPNCVYTFCRKLLEKKVGLSLKGYEFWLQDAQEVSEDNHI